MTINKNDKKLVLYYGLDENNQEKLLIAILQRLGISGIKVKPQDVNQTIGVLAELAEPAENADHRDKLPNDSVVVMHQFSDQEVKQLLDDVRKTPGLSIKLKAVITERNISWSFCDLVVELQREHQFMQTFMAVRNITQQAEQWISENGSQLYNNSDHHILADRMTEAIKQSKMTIAAVQRQEEVDIRQLARIGQQIAQLLDQLSPDT